MAPGANLLYFPTAVEFGDHISYFGTERKAQLPNRQAPDATDSEPASESPVGRGWKGRRHPQFPLGRVPVDREIGDEALRLIDVELVLTEAAHFSHPELVKPPLM